MVIAAVATVYTLFLIYAAGVDKLLLSCILYAPAAALVLQGSARTGPARVPSGRGGAVRGDPPRRGRGCGVLGNRSDRDLTANGERKLK